MSDHNDPPGDTGPPALEPPPHRAQRFFWWALGIAALVAAVPTVLAVFGLSSMPAGDPPTTNDPPVEDSTPVEESTPIEESPLRPEPGGDGVSDAIGGGRTLAVRVGSYTDSSQLLIDGRPAQLVETSPDGRVFHILLPDTGGPWTISDSGGGEACQETVSADLLPMELSLRC